MEDEKLEVVEVALQAGSILLENGAEISRVEDTIDRICRHYGVKSHEAFVLTNGIFMSAGEERGRGFARIRYIPMRGAQLSRVVEVNRVSREIVAGNYTIEEAKEELERIHTMPGKSNLARVLASGIGSAAFCMLFGGSLVDMLAVFVVGAILLAYIIWISEPYLSRITGAIGGGALVTILCIFFSQVLPDTHMNYMIIGSIMPLIQGVAFTNGIRDMADGDYLSGFIRLMDAILGFVCIALGVGIVFIIYQRLFGGVLL